MLATARGAGLMPIFVASAQLNPSHSHVSFEVPNSRLVPPKSTNWRVAGSYAATEPLLAGGRDCGLTGTQLGADTEAVARGAPVSATARTSSAASAVIPADRHVMSIAARTRTLRAADVRAAAPRAPREWDMAPFLGSPRECPGDPTGGQH